MLCCVVLTASVIPKSSDPNETFNYHFIKKELTTKVNQLIPEMLKMHR